MTGGAFDLGGAPRLDQPLGLYRRGRLRDFGAGRRRRRGRRAAAGAAGGEADRPRRARFAAAGGGAAALRPRSRSRAPRRSRPISASPCPSGGARRAAFPAAQRIMPRAASRAPVRQARRPDRRGPPAGARGRGGGRRRGQRGRQGDQRRLLAHARAADRDGLCARRRRRARHATVTLDQRGKMFQATVAPMPFVPHRYHRKGAAG